MSSVVLTQVYCDKTVKDRIMQFSLKCSSVPQLCLPSLITKLEGVPSIGDWVVFDFAMLYFGNGAT